jgi:hypothetical protein
LFPAALNSLLADSENLVHRVESCLPLIILCKVSEANYAKEAILIVSPLK